MEAQSTAADTTSAVYLSNNWLDAAQMSNGVYGWTTPTYSWTSYVTQKVRLKLSEVERLRDAAKADKKLRDVLNKLAPAIEIEVDF